MTALRAVTLDAAGTLFAPAEPIGAVYARVATAHGLRVGADEAERRFRHAFATAPPMAFPGASPHRLAAHERAWWAAIVGAALGASGPAVAAAFDALFAHYARPDAWRVFPDVRPALAALRARGLRLAVVSNFDGRLGPLLDGLGLAAAVDHVEWSTRAGSAKPDPGIFRAALAALHVPAAAAVHVGDGLDADVEGARAAGLRAVLLDRRGTAAPPAGVDVVRGLDELVDRLAASSG